MNAVLKGILKTAEPAEERVGIDPLFRIPSRVQSRLPIHIVDDKSAFGAGHLAALHGMAAFDIVGAGQPADYPVLEAQAEMGGGPDFSSGGDGRKTLHRLHIAAEMAHDIYRVRVQRFN